MASFVAEVRSVERDKFLLLGRHGTLLENGVDGAGWLAGATIYAFIRVDEKLIVSVIVRLTRSGMDAVYWADIHTGAIFDTDTW